MPIVHAVGPARSTVARGDAIRMRTSPITGAGAATEVHPVLAEQPEVDVPDETVGPPVEQVLAVRLDALQLDAVDERGVGGEATLRRRHRERPGADEQLGVVAGEAVDRVTFGHPAKIR